MKTAAMMRKVRAMNEGESCAFLLYNAGEIFGEEAHGSVRAIVSRMVGLQEDEYGIDLEKYDNGGAWNLYTEDHTTPSREFFVSHRNVALDHVPGILGFFAYIAECVRRDDQEYSDQCDREAVASERARKAKETEGGEPAA